MKISWTLSVTALALVLGAFPAFAHQGQLPPPKSVDRQQIDRKIDAVTKTPYMTPHQGKTLKKALDAGEAMKEDEKLTEPNPFQPGTIAGGQGAKPGEAPGSPQASPNSEPDKEAAPPKEEAKPEYRLMGTVCGKGPDYAIFDSGGDWPSMLKPGDRLPDGTLVVSISRGKVCLERVVMPAQPAVQARPGQPAAQGQPEVAEVQARPAQPEKRERYELYVW